MTKAKTQSRFFTFFTTPAGRRVAFVGACATTIGLFVGNFAPHTFGISFYRKFVQCYQNGVEMKVSDKVLDRLDCAFDVLKVSSYERLLIKPFTVFGFDIFQAGSTKYRFGCALGIPANFSYESINEGNRDQIRFRNEPIDWNSEAGKMLKESLILTDDEQIFGMCKAILQLQSHKVLLNSIFPSISFLGVYAFANVTNQNLNLYARPLTVRMFLYSILALFGVGMWSFMKDYTQVWYDTEVDKALGELGPKFIDAGVRYYDKTLKKNIALRKLVGDDTYTAKGNLNYFLRQKSLPLTIRKSYFEMKLNELQKQKDGVSASAA